MSHTTEPKPESKPGSGLTLPNTAGFFMVSQDTEDPKDILFQIEGKAESDIPGSQIKLKHDIEIALTVIRQVCRDDDEKYFRYFNSLLSLAQTGLVGKNANQKVAEGALETLKYQILNMEGPRIKGTHMRRLGKKALLYGIPVAVLLVLIYIAKPAWTRAISYLALWVGSMAGVWLSFGMRKVTLKFEDLGRMEKDFLSPTLRLLFTGSLTIVFGLMLFTNLIVVELGAVSTKNIVGNIELAILVGVLCGLSEKSLSMKIDQNIAKMFSKNK